MKRKQVVVLEVVYEDEDHPHEWDWEDMANEYDDEDAPPTSITVIAMGNPTEVKEGKAPTTDLQSAVMAGLGIGDPMAGLGIPRFGGR